jgi:phosphoglycolate phosphatase-like HAD superfamily hydrolase
VSPRAPGRPRRGGPAEPVGHVVWDWNGTLLDDAAVVIEATITAFREAGLPVTVSPDVYRRHFTRPIQDFYARLLGRPIDPDEWVRMDRAFHHHYGRLQTRAALAPGAVPVLGTLHRRGWTQSVCSMLPHEHLEPAVRAHGIRECFVRVDGLRGGERGGAKLEHLVRHLELLELTTGHVVLVGDTVDDAVAAREAGIACILVDGGQGLHEPAAIAAAGAPVAADLAGALAVLIAGSESGERPAEARATLEW